LPPVVLFHLGLCGVVFPVTSPPGPAGVWPASVARPTATHAWSPNPSPSPNSVFLTSMLIWWACAKALTLPGFLVSECPTRLLLIVGRNLLPAFGFNFANAEHFTQTNKSLSP
jgi:hypothetical protein